MSADLEIPVANDEEGEHFINASAQPSDASSISNRVPDVPDQRIYHTKNDVVQLLLRRNVARVSKVIWDDKSIDVGDATGTVRSIREWPKAAFGTDTRQQ